MQTDMLRFYANYQNEQGRPNSVFLHLGSASRKALSAGLHKDVPHDVDQTPENIEERRVTFWSLYIYETYITAFSQIFDNLTNFIYSWFCFHVGRPSSLNLKDVAIEYPQDQFIRLLAQLCKTITRSVNEIYGQRHESLLHMWRVARSIANDIRGHEAHLQQALGLGLDDSIQAGSLGVRQIIFIARKSTIERWSCPTLTRDSIPSYATSYISPVLDISWSLATREEYRTQPV